MFIPNTPFLAAQFHTRAFLVLKSPCIPGHCQKTYNVYSFHVTIVLAEWKPPVYDNESGITLVTASTRRNSPNVRS